MRPADRADKAHKVMTRREFPETWTVIDRAIQDRVAPGFAGGICPAGPEARPYLFAAGKLGYGNYPDTETDTIFDLASVTKVFATATLAAVLVERGWLGWNSRVCAFFPDYPHREIEVRHLLSHTAGFAAWAPLWQLVEARFAPHHLAEIAAAKRQAAMREIVLAATPEVPVGTRALYSDYSFLLLGFVLEEVTRMPLWQAVRDFVWRPLGVTTGWSGAHYRLTTQKPAAPAKGDAAAIAATELSPWHGVVLQGQVHDENCWAMGGYAGHAGAFGRAIDVLTFARGLLDGFLTPKILQEMWSRMAEPAGCARTLGWDTPTGTESSAGRLFSATSVGHLGFTGTSLWIDPAADLAVVLLSNRVHPTRDNIEIRKLRPRFHDAIRRDWNSRGAASAR